MLVVTLSPIVNNVFGLNLTYHGILGIEDDLEYNAVVTLVAFIIYKEWLVLSLKNKSRNSTTNFDYFREELRTRLEIYKL